MAKSGNSETDIPFCCYGLRNLVSDAGGRGAGVAIWNFEGEIDFNLQFRAIDFDVKSSLIKGPPDLHVSFASSIRISYCPFCGRRLQELAKEFQYEFEGIAAKHRKFFDDLGFINVRND